MTATPRRWPAASGTAAPVRTGVTPLMGQGHALAAALCLAGAILLAGCGGRGSHSTAGGARVPIVAGPAGTAAPARATASPPPAAPGVSERPGTPPPARPALSVASPIATTTRPAGRVVPASPTAAPAHPVTAGRPVRLAIPALGIDAAVNPVGLAPDGAMAAPANPARLGWYTLAARPGERGNAVIAGHVDSRDGPAVFWELRRLVPGAEIVVLDDEGARRRFTVAALAYYPRAGAPLEEIFGPSDGVRLNLITCDQSSLFDRAAREYERNLVIYARAAP